MAWPSLEALLLVPLSAHALFARPLVVGAESSLAIEILHRTHAAARRFNAAATVRIHRTGDGVAFDLTDEREDGDELVTEHGFELWVAPGLEGTVDVVEPHDRLVLRPPGDPERSVRSAH